MGNTMQNQYTEWARQVLSTEAEALQEVSRGLDEAFVQAVEAILNCRGRVVVMGDRQIRPHQPQNRRHHGLHRHAGFFRASGRSCPR